EVGAEVRAAAGPVGRTHEAANDAKLQSDILTYSRSRGLFAGVDIKGVVVRPDEDQNRAVYNKTARELLSDQAGGDAKGSGLTAFPETLGRYASKPGESQ